MKKVLPGQPLAIPAATFNTMIDAAEAYKASQQNILSTPGNLIRLPGMVYCTRPAADQGQYSVVGLGELAVPPSADDAVQNATFENELPIFRAVAPAAGLPAAVLQQPLAMPAGAFAPRPAVKAVVIGFTPADIDISDVNHQYARIQDGSGVLASAASGEHFIAYKPNNVTGVQRCLVYFNGVPRPVYRGWFTIGYNAANDTVSILSYDNAGTVSQTPIYVNGVRYGISGRSNVPFAGTPSGTATVMPVGLEAVQDAESGVMTVDFTFEDKRQTSASYYWLGSLVKNANGMVEINQIYRGEMIHIFTFFEVPAP